MIKNKNQFTKKAFYLVNLKKVSLKFLKIISPIFDILDITYFVRLAIHLLALLINKQTKKLKRFCFHTNNHTENSHFISRASRMSHAGKDTKSWENLID